MIVLRTSTLESFRRVVETAFGDETELRQRLIRGQWDDGPANWMMEAGTEWHRLLASEHHNVIRYGRDHASEPIRQFQFDGEEVLAARKYTGPGLVEVTGRKRFGEFRGVPVIVEGTADHLRGLVIQDHKTKFSPSDPADYAPSLQWRFYLLIHEMSVFRFNLWDFKEPDKNGFCQLRDVHSFNFWPYESMAADCHSWVTSFLTWAEDQNLLRFLLPRRAA